MKRFLQLALLVAVVGCGEGSEAPADPNEEPAREEPTEAEMVTSMEGHYNAVIGAHDALLHGDVDGFRAQFSVLSEQSLPANAPASWAPHYEQLQAAGRSAKDAADLSAASSGLASVVAACGGCHEALDSGPVYPAPAPADSASPLADAMLDHKWASERLWEGVTGPWDNAWQRGSAAMAEVRVFGATGSAAEVSEDLRRRERELRALGEQARVTTGLADRAALYGQLLAGCGDCHQAAGVTFEETD